MNLITICLIFNAFDFVSGFFAGVKTEGIQSSKLRDGLFKKVGFIACYALAYLLEYTENYIDLGININLVPIICGYVILTETVSIIENINKINPDIIQDKIKSLIGLNNKDE